MIERKKYGITPLCKSGKGKFISGVAISARQRGAVMAIIPDLDYEPEDLLSQNQKFCHLHAADLKGSPKAIWDLGLTKIWSPFICTRQGGGRALSFFFFFIRRLGPSIGGRGYSQFFFFIGRLGPSIYYLPKKIS